MSPIPREIYDVLGVIATFVSFRFFRHFFKFWGEPLDKQRKDTLYDIAVGMLVLGGVAFSVYAAKEFYVDNLQAERREAYKAREVRLEQKIEILKGQEEAEDEEKPAR